MRHTVLHVNHADDSVPRNNGNGQECLKSIFRKIPEIFESRIPIRLAWDGVQHRMAHQHTGGEMEVLTTVGEQVGCVLALARMTPAAIAEANHVELVLSSGPISPKN